MIDQDSKSEGSSLWSINKAIDLINNNLITEIDFLYKDVYSMLINHYSNPKA